MTEDEICALPASVDLDTAADALGIGRTTAYQLAKTRFLHRDPDVPVLRLQKGFRVPTAPIKRLLGIEPDESDHTDDTPLPTSNGEAVTRRAISRVLDFSDTPDVGVAMCNRRGRVKVIYPDDTYRVDGEKISGAEIIARGYIHETS